jgi:hypothetical protein
MRSFGPQWQALVNPEDGKTQPPDFDLDPDSVDAMPTYELYVHQGPNTQPNADGLVTFLSFFFT